MAAAPSDFFKIERTASEIKSELLPRAFEIFATSLLLGQSGDVQIPLLCMDLLAALDGHEPTPAAVQWLRQVYRSSNTRLDFNQSTQIVLYDVDKSALAEVKEKVEQLPFYKDILHSPAILCKEPEECIIHQWLEAGQPAFGFLDPTIEGISQQMLLRAVQAGPDLLMLFNPKLLENAIRKAKADSLWQQLFGTRLEQVRSFYKQNRNADKREEYLLDCFEEIFRSKGLYTLRFRINRLDKKQTNHYLVFSIKSAPAYIKLKEILREYSDYQEDGVPLFGANLQVQQLALFQEFYKYSVAKLAQELSDKGRRYSNRSLQHIYEQHSLGTPYTLTNYQTAYEKLMRQGDVRFINPKTGQAVTKLTPSLLIRYKK